MPRNPKLNDLQLILLSTAAQREDGSILPFPDQLAAESDRVGKAVPPLLRSKLIQETPVTARAKLWREEGDQLVGLAITDKGRAVLGIGEEGGTQPGPPASPGEQASAGNLTTGVPRARTKAEQVLTLLRRDDGATLAELVAATDWLPHTTRAALTGMRKKGHTIEKSKRGKEACYRIGAAG